jgi:hypothetical protein
MQNVWRMLFLVASSLVMVAAGARAGRHVEATPEKYLRGQVESDVATALKRGADEHRPVWIVAWDKAFFNSPAARDDNIADYSLHYFYQNPETKNIVAQNFVQAFTTLDDPAIAPWVGQDRRSHEPVFIVIGADGMFVTCKDHRLSVAAALKEVQSISASLGLRSAADGPPPGTVHSTSRPEPPSAQKFLIGSVTNDVTAALQHGVAEHFPVWITVWDKPFFDSPDGADYNPSGYALRNFYQKPEVKSFLSQHFIQVFTTTDDPALARWIDKTDLTHEPLYIVFDADGKFALREHSNVNPETAWKDVQKVAAELGIKFDATDPGAAPAHLPPVVQSKPEPAAVAAIAQTPAPSRGPAPGATLASRLATPVPSAPAATAPPRSPAPAAVLASRAATPVPSAPAATAPPRSPAPAAVLAIRSATPVPSAPAATEPPRSPAPAATLALRPVTPVPTATAPPAVDPVRRPAHPMNPPEVTAMTNLASRQIAELQTGSTRVEQDKRIYSVNVNCHFLSDPEEPYEVQCFFIARPEGTTGRSIFDAVAKTAHGANANFIFTSQPLAGTKRTFRSVPFTTTSLYSNGSIGTSVGVSSSYSEVKGQKVDGWIVRVVAQGRVLSVKSNQPPLAELAAHLQSQLDAVIAKVPRTAGDDMGGR